MYYDNITDKMIPGVFIVVDNKIFKGYIDCIICIKNYINRQNNNIDKLNIKSYTSDLEIGLIRAFDLFFNKEKKNWTYRMLFPLFTKYKKIFTKKII